MILFARVDVVTLEEFKRSFLPAAHACFDEIAISAEPLEPRVSAAAPLDQRSSAAPPPLTHRSVAVRPPCSSPRDRAPARMHAAGLSTTLPPPRHRRAATGCRCAPLSGGSCGETSGGERCGRRTALQTCAARSRGRGERRYRRRRGPRAAALPTTLPRRERGRRAALRSAGVLPSVAVSPPHLPPVRLSLRRPRGTSSLLPRRLMSPIRRRRWLETRAEPAPPSSPLE